MNIYDRKKLYNKNAIITGGSNGIGKAIAKSFAKEGANLIITYYKDKVAADRIIEEIEEFGTKIKSIQIDLSITNNVNNLINESLNFLGKIDILINNVGLTTRTDFIEITEEQYDIVLATNLKSPFFLTQIVSKHMIKNKIKGSIINISSISSRKSISRIAHYQCSKAALSMLTKSVAYELAPYGIRVNTISPGLTATNGNLNQWKDNPELWSYRCKDIPIGRAGIPEDHAGAAVFLASDVASWITGSDIVIDGGESTI